MSKEYMAKYYQENKARYTKYNYSIHCEHCNTVVPKNYWARHARTKKHLQNAGKESGLDPTAHTPNANPKQQHLIDKLNRNKEKAKQLLTKIRNMEEALVLSKG